MTPAQEAILALRERTYGCGTCRTCIEHLQTAALIEKLAIDAERYRWLRDNRLSGEEGYLFARLMNWKIKLMLPEDVDTAIDAARNK